jgi:SAM-dependent methyltransferase
VLAKARGLTSIARSALGDRGPLFVAARAADYAVSFWMAQYYNRIKPRETFSALGREYAYFYHLYNVTWKNERAIEIAVAMDFLEQHPYDRMLEVGNVLSWYRHARHDILDKYEVTAGVINEDVVDFDPGHTYEVIVSISTLEHVGWDETPRDPKKVLLAVEHQKQLLAPGGGMLVTVPIAYNPTLDAVLADEMLGFSRHCFMKRLARTRWRQATWDEVKDARYDHPYRCANALMIGIYERPGVSVVR